MDGAKRKRKSFEFAEGHKRETRKSYQSFIESAGKSSPAALGIVALSQIKSEEMADDGVRKSSRKPVPKKSFDLVDTFEEKSPLSKHITNSRQKSGNSAHINPYEYGVTHIKEEPLTEDYDSAPRKSNRVPVPKKCFDLIDPNLKGRTAVNQQDSNRTDGQIKTQKKTNQSNVEKANVVICEAEGKNFGGKAKRTQYGKTSNKTDVPPQILPDLQMQDHEKKEKSRFTLKLDFKAKKDKRNRKRKLATATDQSSTSVRMEGPSEKIAKVVEDDNINTIEDNIEKSALVEALQALKQPPQNSLVEVSESPQLEGKSKITEAEDKASKLGSKKAAAKVKRRAGNNHNIPMHAEKASEEEKGSQANIGRSFSASLEKGWDYSRSTTEISDGHVILKLEGLHTPSKAKKHRKKHKNLHHKAEIENEESKNAEPLNSREPDVTAFAGNQDSQYEKNLSMEKEVSSSELAFPSEIKEKKTKSHKKKRKLSQSKLLDPQLDSPKNAIVGRATEDDELTIKKRKIYKKKKGEKILVRIQTEFWNKNGDLVKVEPMNIKENKPTEAKEKSLVKQKKSQDLSINSVVTEKQSSMELNKNNLSNATSMEIKQGAKRDQVLKSSSKKKESNPSIPNMDHVKTSFLKSFQTKIKLSSDISKGTQSKKKKERKTQTLTAYLLFCRKYRPQVVFENPNIGFSEISKKLAHMWKEAPEKEKDVYKKQLEEHRAKVNASIRKETSKKLKTTKQDGQVSPEKCEKGQSSSGRVSSREYQIAPQKYSLGNLEPVDMGAHLQLLGESLMLVSTALRRQILSKSSDLKVYGSLSVLLDSSLCAMAPLLFLTSFVPQLDVIPPAVRANTLDSIAYILPGL